MRCFICGEEFDDEQMEGVNIVAFGETTPKKVNKVKIRDQLYELCQKCLKPFIAGAMIAKDEDYNFIE